MITAPVSRAAKGAALASAGAASPGDYTFLFKIAGDMNDEDNMLRMGQRAKAHAEELALGSSSSADSVHVRTSPFFANVQYPFF